MNTSEALYYTMYSGIISQNPHDSEEFAGVMQDRYGESVLSDVVIFDKTLSFIKRYKNSDAGIRYFFDLKGDTWFGTFSESVVGEGMSKCILTEVSDHFFQPKL